MASLYNKTVASTFKSLLKLNDNDIISATEKQITDGLGGSTSVFIDTYGNLRASKYKVTGGTSGQFLKADGSLDSNAYITAAFANATYLTISNAAATYLPITTAAATYLTITNAASTYLPIGTTTDGISEGTTNKYFTNARAIGATLTGFTPVAGTVTSADTILTAIEKIYASLGGGGGGGGDFVPYTGADNNVDLGEFGMLAGFLQYDTTPTDTPTAQGTTYWDENESTIAVVLNGTTGHVMQDLFFNVKNQSGANIAKGTNVSFAGTLGASGRLLIEEFTADGSIPAEYYMGVTNEDIPDGEDGKVIAFGKIRHLDTSLYPDGTLLYCSDVAGNFTDIKPTSPNLTILVAAVVHSDDVNGVIQVRPTYNQKISDASDVRIADLTDEDILQWNDIDLSWKNINLFTALGATDVGKALLAIPPAGLTIPPTTKPRGIRINVDNTVSALEVGDQGYIPFYDDTDFYVNSPIYVDSYGKVIVNGEVGFYEFTVNGEFLADNVYINTFSKLIANTVDSSLSLYTNDGVDWIENLRLYNDGSIKQSAVTNALIGADNLGVLRAGTKADLETILGAPATSGTLTANYIPVATDVDSITDSMIYQDGTNGIVINGTSSAYKLQVNGTFGADEINIFGTGKITANLVSGYITHQVLNGTTYNNVLRLHKNQDIQQFKVLDGIVYADASGYLAEATSGQIIAGLGFVPYNSTNPDGFIAPGTFFATSPLSWNMSTNTISMTQASDLNNGWLSASDWTMFNNKGNGTVTSVALSVPTGFAVSGSPVTTSGTLSLAFASGYSLPSNTLQASWTAKQDALSGTGFVKISGTTISYDNNTYYLASNPNGYTSNVGTVTNVAALTIGTTGTDISSSVATSTTTPVITLNIPTASATTRGALSSADWNTFNNKQNALTYTPVPNTRTLTINGTTFDLSADRSWTLSTSPTSRDVFDFTATSGQTVFTITGGYTVGLLDVYSNGVKLTSSEFTAINATTFTLSVPAVSGDQIQAIRYNATIGSGLSGTGTANYIPKFTATSIIGNSLIYDNGNNSIGIGTTSPLTIGNSSILHINGTTSSFITLSYGGTRYLTMLSVSSRGTIATTGATPLTFETNEIERMRITSGGNVGVGTSTPFSQGTGAVSIEVNGTNYGQIYVTANSSTSRGTIMARTSDVYLGSITNSPLIFGTNDTERMRIGSDGTKYFGVYNGSRFQMNSAGESFYQYTSGYYIWGLYNDSNSLNIESAFGGNIIFRAAAQGTSSSPQTASERMRITTDGCLLINTTSVSSTTFKLQVNSPILSVGSSSSFLYTNRNDGTIYSLYATGGITYFYTTTNVASINMSSGAYTALSDVNKKKDFEVSNIGLSEILKLEPTLFRMKSDNENIPKQLGFIAQQVKDIIPQAYVEGDDFIGLQDRPIVAALVKAVQELTSRLQSLENK